MTNNHNSDTQMLLYRARLLLEEGRNEEARTVLEAIHTEEEKQQREVAYLLGWCYVQQKQWHEAINALTPLLPHLSSEEEQETTMDRERLALYLLRLGTAAFNLAHYEDASLHFNLCLKVLHDRRVHLPLVRIKARYHQAAACLMRGLYPSAIQHYEEALRLCHHYNNEDELPNIYYGLCDTYRRLGDFVKAYLVGQEALKLYQKKSDRPMEAETQNLLGRICYLLGDFREASDHYTESLALSTSTRRLTMTMLNCAALADLRLAEERLEEAKRYAQLAVENAEQSDDAHMRGLTYQVVGRVTYKEARESAGSRQRELLEKAAQWYRRAEEELAKTQAFTTMSEVYGSRAELLEELGQEQEAIECWRLAYEMLSHSKEAGA